MLDREELSGAVESLLNFFTDKKDTVLFAELKEFLHKDRMCWQNACIPLDGFNYHSCNFVRRHPGRKSRLYGGDAVSLTDFIWNIIPEERKRIDFRKEGAHLFMHLGRTRRHG